MIWFRKKHPFLCEEEKLQIGCVRWFERTYPGLVPLLHHSPNEGERTWFERVKLRQMGMRKGFPDLVLMIPCQGYSALCIELKTASGRLSEAQRKEMNYLKMSGKCKVSVVRSENDFRNLINDYLK